MLIKLQFLRDDGTVIVQQIANGRDSQLTWQCPVPGGILPGEGLPPIYNVIVKLNVSPEELDPDWPLEATSELLSACIALLDAPHQEHFAVRLNDPEMAALDRIKAVVAKYWADRTVDRPVE